MISPEERRELRRLKRKIVQYQYKNKENTIHNLKKDNMGWIHFLTIFAFFMGFFLLIQFGSVTVISFWGMSKIFAIFLAIGLLIPIKWYRKKWTMNIYEYFLVSLLGIAPFFSGLIFLINFSFSHTPHIESYEIEKISEGNLYSDIHLKNDTLSEYGILTSNDSREYQIIENAKKVEYHLEYGALGMKVLMERKFKY